MTSAYPRRESKLVTSSPGSDKNCFNVNIKLRDTQGSGSADIAPILSALAENWEQFQESLGNLEEFEQTSIKDYFNALSQSGELGDRMFHDEYDGDENLGQLL